MFLLYLIRSSLNQELFRDQNFFIRLARALFPNVCLIEHYSVRYLRKRFWIIFIHAQILRTIFFLIFIMHINILEVLRSSLKKPILTLNVPNVFDDGILFSSYTYYPIKRCFMEVVLYRIEPILSTMIKRQIGISRNIYLR